jgi:hypothetical protein
MNRTADSPLDVLIFGALPVGLEVEPLFWDDLAAIMQRNDFSTV